MATKEELETRRKIAISLTQHRGHYFDDFKTPAAMAAILKEILTAALQTSQLPPELCNRLKYPTGYDHPDSLELHLATLANYAYQKALDYRLENRDFPEAPDRKENEPPHELLQRLANWFIQADSGAGQTENRPPLGEIAGLIYEKLKSLPEHKGMISRQIADWLLDEHKTIIDESTVRKNHLTQLEPYGLQHAKRKGYYIR